MRLAERVFKYVRDGRKTCSPIMAHFIDNDHWIEDSLFDVPISLGYLALETAAKPLFIAGDIVDGISGTSRIRRY